MYDSAEETVQHIEDTLSALFSARREPSVVSGVTLSLRRVLDRQIETRTRELADQSRNLSRNQSVIVTNPQASTPDPSLIIAEQQELFFGSDNTDNLAPPTSVVPRFEIYQDSESVLAAPRPIPVITTPSSVSVGKENIHPDDLLDLSDRDNHQEAATDNMGDAADEAAAKEKGDALRGKAADVEACIDMYEPSLFSAAILRTS